MLNCLMIVVILAVLVLFICAVGVIYCRSERKREESMLMEEKAEKEGGPDAGLTRMAMHTRYNGLSTRGRMN